MKMAIQFFGGKVAEAFDVDTKLVGRGGAKFWARAKIADIGLKHTLPIEQNDVLQAVHKNGYGLKTTAVQVIVGSAPHVKRAFLNSGCAAKKNADFYFHRSVAENSAIKYEKLLRMVEESLVGREEVK